MTYSVSDDRLAWLAMRDYCAEKARRHGFVGLIVRIFASGNSGGYYRQRGTDLQIISRSGGDYRREVRGDKMMDYAVAVDVCAQRMSTEERAVLRRTGALPDWFVDAVETEYADVRASRG